MTSIGRPPPPRPWRRRPASALKPARRTSTGSTSTAFRMARIRRSADERQGDDDEVDLGGPDEVDERVGAAELRDAVDDGGRAGVVAVVEDAADADVVARGRREVGHQARALGPAADDDRPALGQAVVEGRRGERGAEAAGGQDEEGDERQARPDRQPAERQAARGRRRRAAPCRGIRRGGRAGDSRRRRRRRRRRPWPPRGRGPRRGAGRSRRRRRHRRRTTGRARGRSRRGERRGCRWSRARGWRGGGHGPPCAPRPRARAAPARRSRPYGSRRVPPCAVGASIARKS